MRTTLVLSAICTCIALACTPTEPDPSTGESAPTPEVVPEPEPEVVPSAGAWVVIDERRGLFESAAEDKPIPLGQPAEAGPRLRIAEVVAIAGEFVELRTIATPDAQACSGSLGLERNVQLRFFAKLDALHPVLARPKRLEFGDGTKLELAAGVPVIEPGEKGRIQVGRTQLIANIGEQDIGRWFPAPTGDPLPVPSLRVPDNELHYGEHGFVGEWPPFRSAHEEQDIENGRLLTFADACGRFVLRTGPSAKSKSGLYAMKGPKDAIPRMARNFDPDTVARNAGILGVMQEDSGHFLASPYGGAFAVRGDDDVWGGLTATDIGEAYGVGGLGLIDCKPVTWTASVGTSLSWSSGGEAGTVLAAHELPSSAKELDGRVCFTASGLDVCIESSKLEREDTPECRPASEGGFGRRATSNKPNRVTLDVKGASVSRGLDPDIIRRIIRAHINEVRSCYNKGLVTQPTLAGKVAIAFSIKPDGKVESSKVHASTLEPATERVPDCIAKAVKRWTFPKPFPSTTVDVVYPFELSPG
jgi:hypothetical protein